MTWRTDDSPKILSARNSCRTRSSACLLYLLKVAFRMLLRNAFHHRPRMLSQTGGKAPQA
jgi:hypothetical protein